MAITQEDRVLSVIDTGPRTSHLLSYPNTLSSMYSVSSVAQLCPTLWDPMDCSMPGLPVHHQLPEFTQTHVHRVGDTIQASHPLSSTSSPAFTLSQHEGLFQWVSSSHQVAKVLELQLQHQSFQWIFTVDFLYDWLAWSPCSPSDSQESSPIPQFKNINSSALRLLYGPTLTVVLFYTDLCWQSDSPFFNMLSSFVITFLSRSKRLLISWKQSLSAVIVELKKIKSVTVSSVSPSICHRWCWVAIL